MKPTSLVLSGLLVGVAGTLGALWALQKAPRQTSVQQPTALAPNEAPVRVMPKAVPTREHNYDVVDGIQYGYTMALSDVQRQAGQVGNQVFMVAYAGERNGVFQVHAEQNGVLLAFECSRPCDVVKAMTVIDRDDLRDQVRVEYVKNVPGMLAALALDDAMNGRLKPYVEYDGPRRWAVWVDAKRGVTRSRDRESEARAASAAGR